MIKAGKKDGKIPGFAIIDNDTKKTVGFYPDDGKVASFKNAREFDLTWHKLPSDTRKAVTKDTVKVTFNR